MWVFPRHLLQISLFTLGLAYSLCSWANQYPLPAPYDVLIGDIQYTSVPSNATPTTVAQEFNVGLNAILAANPGTTETVLATNYVKVPSEFLLPPLPRKGIIINLPEMRLYYYPKDSNVVLTFPVGIGRIGKTIPITNTAIARKVVNPVWIPPADIRQFNKDQGIELPRVMPAGPDNPLGPYAIYLKLPTFLIHSTIFPESIGRRASFGCIRMNEADIKEFFPIVQSGTSVAIIDMPTKVGWEGDELYIEAHPPLEERRNVSYANLAGMINTVENALPRDGVTLVDWQLITDLSEEPDGVPHEIGVRMK